MQLLGCWLSLIWKQATINFPELPSTQANGWKITESGHLGIDWIGDEDILPTEIVDILANREQQTDNGVDRELDEGEEWFSESDSEDDFTDSDDEPCLDN